MKRMVFAWVAWAMVLAASPAWSQEAPPPPPDSTQPGPLFESDDPLFLRFEGDLETLLKDRDSVTSTFHRFKFTYRVGEAEPVALNLDVKTRGHWRRQEKNCDFPPLMLDFPRTRIPGTLFARQNRLKLVTPCRPGRKEFVEYVLREYLVYQVHNVLTPLSLRARLATTTYVDTERPADSLTVPTFLIEDDERMAVRNGATLLELRGARFDDLDSVQLGLAAVFLYLIGGTDWSLPALHNIELVRVEQSLALYAVPYDFDWTGMVNARYGFPDSRLGIRTVRDRLYRGPCLSDAHWGEVLDVFRARKDAIYAVYDSVPGLDPKYLRETRRYLDDFYQTIDTPGALSRELIRKCRQTERS
jgi:hypothetical protein